MSAESFKVDAMGRRVWDKDHFSEIARRKADLGSEDEEDEKFVPLPASQRGYLQKRDQELKLEKNLNKFKVVLENTKKSERGGYWCNVCECLLKDSRTYLDHINGRRHNRLLGMTMKVEKQGVDAVKSKIASLSRSNDVAARQEAEPEGPSADDIALRLARLEEQERMRKERKKDKKRKKAEKKEAAFDLDALQTYEAMRSTRKDADGDGDADADADEDEDASGPEGYRGESGVKRVKTSGIEGDDEEAVIDNERAEMMKALGLPVGFGS